MNTIKYTVLSCALMALMGCSNEPKTTQTPEVAKPEVQPLMLNCDDASIKNRLVREVQSALGERATTLIKDYEDADEVGLSRRLQQRLAELALDLQDVTAVENKESACQANLQVLFTADDIKYANAHAKNTQTAEVADLLAKHKLGLAADNSVTLPLQYLVSGMDVSIKDTPDAFDTVAQILVASAYGSATNDEVVNIAGRTAPTIIPIAPIAPVAVPRPEILERAAQNDTDNKADSSPSDKAEPKAETKADNKTTQEGVTRTITKAQTLESSDGSNSSDTSNNLDTKAKTSESKAGTQVDNKAESASEKAEPAPSPETKAEPKAEPKAEAKPDDTDETN